MSDGEPALPAAPSPIAEDEAPLLPVVDLYWDLERVPLKGFNALSALQAVVGVAGVYGTLKGVTLVVHADHCELPDVVAMKDSGFPVTVLTAALGETAASLHQVMAEQLAVGAVGVRCTVILTDKPQVPSWFSSPNRIVFISPALPTLASAFAPLTCVNWPGMLKGVRPGGPNIPSQLSKWLQATEFGQVDVSVAKEGAAFVSTVDLKAVNNLVGVRRPTDECGPFGPSGVRVRVAPTIRIGPPACLLTYACSSQSAAEACSVELSRLLFQDKWSQLRPNVDASSGVLASFSSGTLAPYVLPHLAHLAPAVLAAQVRAGGDPLQVLDAPTRLAAPAEAASGGGMSYAYGGAASAAVPGTGTAADAAAAPGAAPSSFMLPLASGPGPAHSYSRVTSLEDVVAFIQGAGPRGVLAQSFAVAYYQATGHRLLLQEPGKPQRKLKDILAGCPRVTHHGTGFDLVWVYVGGPGEAEGAGRRAHSHGRSMPTSVEDMVAFVKRCGPQGVLSQHFAASFSATMGTPLCLLDDHSHAPRKLKDVLMFCGELLTRGSGAGLAYVHASFVGSAGAGGGGGSGSGGVASTSPQQLVQFILSCGPAGVTAMSFAPSYKARTGVTLCMADEYGRPRKLRDVLMRQAEVACVLGPASLPSAPDYTYVHTSFLEGDTRVRLYAGDGGGGLEEAGAEFGGVPTGAPSSDASAAAAPVQPVTVSELVQFLQESGPCGVTAQSFAAQFSLQLGRPLVLPAAAEGEPAITVASMLAGEACVVAEGEGPELRYTHTEPEMVSLGAEIENLTTLLRLNQRGIEDKHIAHEYLRMFRRPLQLLDATGRRVQLEDILGRINAVVLEHHSSGGYLVYFGDVLHKEQLVSRLVQVLEGSPGGLTLAALLTHYHDTFGRPLKPVLPSGVAVHLPKLLDDCEHVTSQAVPGTHHRKYFAVPRAGVAGVPMVRSTPAPVPVVTLAAPVPAHTHTAALGPGSGGPAVGPTVVQEVAALLATLPRGLLGCSLVRAYEDMYRKPLRLVDSVHGKLKLKQAFEHVPDIIIIKTTCDAKLFHARFRAEAKREQAAALAPAAYAGGAGAGGGTGDHADMSSYHQPVSHHLELGEGGGLEEDVEEVLDDIVELLRVTPRGLLGAQMPAAYLAMYRRPLLLVDSRGTRLGLQACLLRRSDVLSIPTTALGNLKFVHIIHARSMDGAQPVGGGGAGAADASPSASPARPLPPSSKPAVRPVVRPALTPTERYPGAGAAGSGGPGTGTGTGTAAPSAPRAAAPPPGLARPHSFAGAPANDGYGYPGHSYAQALTHESRQDPFQDMSPEEQAFIDTTLSQALPGVSPYTGFHPSPPAPPAMPLPHASASASAPAPAGSYGARGPAPTSARALAAAPSYTPTAGPFGGYPSVPGPAPAPGGGRNEGFGGLQESAPLFGTWHPSAVFARHEAPTDTTRRTALANVVALLREYPDGLYMKDIFTCYTAKFGTKLLLLDDAGQNMTLDAAFVGCADIVRLRSSSFGYEKFVHAMYVGADPRLAGPGVWRGRQ